MGEREGWPPPGWWAAALLIPSSTLGTLCAGLLVGKALSPALEALPAGARIGVTSAALVLLLALFGAGQVLVVAGRAQARHWMLAYAWVLLLLSLPAGYKASARMDWILLSLAAPALVSSHALMRSRSYRAFAGFYRMRRIVRDVRRGG